MDKKRKALLYNQLNKDKLKSYQKKFQDNNREEMLEYHQIYRIINREKITKKRQQINKTRKNKKKMLNDIKLFK